MLTTTSPQGDQQTRVNYSMLTTTSQQGDQQTRVNYSMLLEATSTLRHFT